MGYYFSNEIVFEGHPDKVCDQISDALLDAYLLKDKNSRCGIEVVGGKGKIFVTGEVTSTAEVNVKTVVKWVLKNVGYSDDYEVIDNLGKQSPDISQGVDIGGAGDQGMMFGYACRETENYIPLAMQILQEFSMGYSNLRSGGWGEIILPDGKAQITGYYDENDKLQYIEDFVISYQNTETDRAMTDAVIRSLAVMICNRYNIKIKRFHLNPTGKFFVGGFDGDAGLTGRKIVVDSYHSFSHVGGGAFSGKDATKVDRSGAYKARQLAIRWLKEHTADTWCEVQISYAIGLDKPMAIYIHSDSGDHDCTEEYSLECTPAHIIEELGLRDIKYYNTARFGHFGIEGFSWEVR